MPSAGEPAPGVDLPVGLGFVLRDRDGKIQHQRIGGGKVAAFVKMNLPAGEPQLFPEFPDGGLLRALSLADIAGAENVKGPAILPDEDDLRMGGVFQNHADSGIEDREAVFPADVAEGHISLVLQELGMKLCAAVHAEIHFHGRVRSLQL